MVYPRCETRITTLHANGTQVLLRGLRALEALLMSYNSIGPDSDTLDGLPAGIIS